MCTRSSAVPCAPIPVRFGARSRPSFLNVWHVAQLAVNSLWPFSRLPPDCSIAGLNCAHAYSALSLHTPVSGDDSGTEMGDLLGDVDHDLDGVEDREALRPMIARLPRREQRILAMRFSGNMTQSQIAAEIGISQMHVSRLLSGALARLRGWLVAEA